MLRKGLMLSAPLALVVASTAYVRADICFEYTGSSPGIVAVAIGAKVPATPNACITISVVDQSAPGGVATGSICRSEEGSSRPTLVYHYTYNSCVGSYFESATCRLELESNGDLPAQKSNSQSSSCSGVAVNLMTGQSGPLGGWSYSNDLKAWNCSPGPFAVPGGGGAQCVARANRRALDTPFRSRGPGHMGPGHMGPGHMGPGHMGQMGPGQMTPGR
jgi:hypothetical protein